MRTFFRLFRIALLIGAGFLMARCAPAHATVVTNTYTLHNPDGTAYTNPFVMTVYPPQNNSVVVVGTNIVVGGGYPMTNTPNSSGKGSVVCEPNQYKVYLPSANIQFYVNIQATNPIADFSALTTNVPVVFIPNSFFAWFTNNLGFYPLASNYAALYALQGYQPATNSFGCITNLLGGVPTLNTSNSVVAALGITPVASTYYGVTNALHFAPATNTEAGLIAALGFQPMPNTYGSVTNVLGGAVLNSNQTAIANGFTNAFGFTPLAATTNAFIALWSFTPLANTYSAVTNALTYKPMGQYNGPMGDVMTSLGYVPLSQYLTNAAYGAGLTTNRLFLDENTNAGTMYVTNGFIWKFDAP